LDSKLVLNTNSEELKKIDFEDFDIFAFNKKVSKDNTLPLIGKYILSTEQYLNIIDSNKLEAFLIKVRMGYLKNPYHNVFNLIVIIIGSTCF